MWLFLIGVASGVISGMGIGGGTILIPALCILFGFQQQSAQHINLLYFIPTALIALVTHVKEGNIQKDVTKQIIFFGVAGAILGSFLAINLNSEILRKCFGFFLLAMGLVEFFKKVPSTKSLPKRSIDKL